MLDSLVVCFTLISVSLGQDSFFLLSGPPGNVIYKIDKSSGTYTDIPILQQQPCSVQYDRKTGRIFYSATDQVHIYSTKTDGSNSKEEADTANYPNALAIDDCRRYIFVSSQWFGPSIKRLQLDVTDGTQAQNPRLIDFSQNVTHMATDPATGVLFLGSDKGVYQCSYNGTGTQMLLNNSASSNGITFDDTHIYAIRGNVIWRISRTYHDVKKLFTISKKDNQAVQGLAAAGGHLYFTLNYCNQGPATQNCDTYIYRVHKDGTQYEAFSQVIRTPYCSMLKLLYVTPLQQNGTTSSLCPAGINGLHVVDDNYKSDSSVSNNTLALCLILIPLSLFLAAIGLFFCWKKVFKLEMGSDSDAAINETLNSGQYMELTEEQKF
ncbi:uncharacterized protein LOC132545515 [Ylistrum balloti]|uniref:uncharacterized protein LOC132545515 n=1 Tax=Ylistrum balloti TaxID=509963 RepID=UPI002905A987|nr:uncharacterized protein LOC132545515 [Ylistrum balloti]